MPTYEYACASCEHHFEIFQSIVAEPLKRCPSCERDALKRLIGAGAGIIFKGSGFYETDYKKASGRPEKGEKDDSKSAGKETASSDKEGTASTKKEATKSTDSKTVSSESGN